MNVIASWRRAHNISWAVDTARGKFPAKLPEIIIHQAPSLKSQSDSGFGSLACASNHLQTIIADYYYYAGALRNKMIHTHPLLTSSALSIMAHPFHVLLHGTGVTIILLIVSSFSFNFVYVKNL